MISHNHKYISRLDKKPVINTGFFVQNYPRIKRYAKAMTAPQTNMPTDTSKRLLLAIVVTRDDIHVLSCVKTVVSPSRFAVTSATFVEVKKIHPLSVLKSCRNVDRRKQETNKSDSKRQNYSTGKNKNDIIFSCARRGDRHAEYITKKTNHLFSPYQVFFQSPQL